MEINKFHWAGIAIGLLILVGSLFLIGNQACFFVVGMGILVAAFPFVFSLIHEGNVSYEKEEMFLEFARNLVESVKTGTPISKSIVNVGSKPYGALSIHVRKLANQISMGIPLTTALQTFAKEANNKTISRALTLIGQAEKAGGDIGEILEAVANAVSMSDKLKKERKALISTLVVQGYIVFAIFLIIVLVMQFKILPLVSGIAEIETVGGGVAGIPIGGGDIEGISNSFLYLLLVQGFFSGLAIGKLAEGNIKAGIKHSFALMLMSFLVSAGASLFFV